MTRFVHPTATPFIATVTSGVLMHWFPERKFVFAGDNAYGSHAMARFANRHAGRLTLISKIVADANLFAPPPRRRKGTNGRPPIKGRSLPSPAEVARSKRRPKKLRVRWYGGGWRNADVYTGVGCWYESGKGIVEIRWVYVIDRDGTHRDECFFATDAGLQPASPATELGRQGLDDAERHDHQRSPPFVDSMGICTGAGRQCR